MPKRTLTKGQVAIRQCPVCGKTENDNRITSHTHYWGDKPYNVKFVHIVSDKYAKRIPAQQ